jgi:phytanoyl-CoA hydroxylase
MTMIINRSIQDHYFSKGWVVVENVYPHGEVDRIVRLAMSVAEARAAAGDTSDMDKSADGAESLPRKIDFPFLLDAGFRSFVLNTRLSEILQVLIGKPPRLFSDQIFMKPPRVGSEKPFHQDNFYFQFEPADEVITAWIALDDVDEANGCLRYINGSHKGPLLPHGPRIDQPQHLVPPLELIDLTRESLAPVKKGGVVFHHSKALHTSGPNRSDRWRRAYATHWITAEVQDLQGPKGRLADAYCSRPDLFDVTA